MIAMSHASTSSGTLTGLAVEYHPAKVTDRGYTRPASVWITMENEQNSAHTTVFLDIEHVRQLAEQLPDILMSHDAAERAAREQATAVAESQAA
ncbi:hypothetical protein ACFWM1_06390 [Nocardia sp. NPDC058379]|uniref:hypothetical protein n=1 Tax=unclassified Nocardia TaxID=2637762 RepID=UPI0036696AB0